MLAGEVVAKGGDIVSVETTERTPGGDYPDTHDVYFEDGAPDSHIGSRIQLVGKVAKDPDDPRTLRLTADTDNVRDYDGNLDINIGKVSGKLHRGFEYFRPKEDKRAFGNLLLVVDEDFYMRGVVLTAPACMEIKEAGTYLTGAEIEIQGRLQTRPFESQGEKRIALEIVVNPDKTKILKDASLDDAFADFDEKLIEAI